MTLSFLRNKIIEVELLSENTLSVSWRLVDSLTVAQIRIKVQLPDLEITESEARMERSPHPECFSATELIHKVVGIRVGSGLRKIIMGLIGGSSGCSELVEGVLECCNAVILHFTVPQIQSIENGNEEERRKGFQDMLRFNPRLVRSCIAFDDDSPLMEGLNL